MRIGVYIRRDIAPRLRHGARERSVAGRAKAELCPKTGTVTKQRKCVSDCVGERAGVSSPRRSLARVLAACSLPVLFVLAGCGGQAIGAASSGNLSISPGTATIDTNCTGCNATGASGVVVEQLLATLGGRTADVRWSVSGGDRSSGAGTIDASGRYTPPSYLTADSVQVTLTASLADSPSTQASTKLTIRPGFLQPLTPENVALGPEGTATITAYIAEAGGSAGVSFALPAQPQDRAAGWGHWARPAARGAAAHSRIARCGLRRRLPFERREPLMLLQPPEHRAREKRPKCC